MKFVKSWKKLFWVVWFEKEAKKSENHCFWKKCFSFFWVHFSGVASESEISATYKKLTAHNGDLEQNEEVLDEV